MNREHKYRAWNPDKKRFEYFTLAEHAPVTTVKIPAEGTWDILEPWEQYTGQKDKTGKVYCAGDIYKFQNGTPRMVFFKNGAFCGGWSINDCSPLGWCGDEDEPNLEVYECDFPSQCEIIGNKHQNPELIP